MSAFTVIRLDTTPPVITWGPVDGAVASETMTVLYLLDEPEMTAASFSIGGVVLPGVVHADRVTVELPEDTVEGVGVLSAMLRDDVGNATIATLNIPVSGVIPTTPTIPVLPGPPVDEEPWRTRSRALARTRYRVLSTRRLPSRATISTRIRVARSPVGSPPTKVAGRSGGAVRAHLGSTTKLLARDQWTITRRPEGPETEAAIILELL